MDELDNLIKESNEPYNDTDNKNKSTPNSKVGRNDPCPCGSGKKYKKCCFKIKPVGFIFSSTLFFYFYAFQEYHQESDSNASLSYLSMDLLPASELSFL